MNWIQSQCCTQYHYWWDSRVSYNLLSVHCLLVLVFEQPLQDVQDQGVAMKQSHSSSSTYVVVETARNTSGQNVGYDNNGRASSVSVKNLTSLIIELTEGHLKK